MHKITYLCPPGNQGDITSFLENICLGERDGVGLHRNLLHWETTNANTFLSPPYLCTCIDGVQTHTMHLNMIWLRSLSLTLRGQKTIPKHPDSSNSYLSFIQNPRDDLMHDLMVFLCMLSVLNLLSLTTNHCWDINQKHKLKFVPKGGLPFCSLCSQDLFKHEHVQAYGLNNSK